MHKKVGVGIVGLGFMGSTHFRIHEAEPSAKIVAVADVNPRKRKGDWSEILGNIGDIDNTVPVDMSDIAGYEDYKELIADPNVDLVDICIPTNVHKAVVIEALRAGKSVLCEKPIGRTLAEADEILNVAMETGEKMMVGHCIRFWPEYVEAKRILDSGKLGTVISASLRRISPSVQGNSWENWLLDAERSGGALLDLHLHDTDAVQHFFGKPCGVTAFAAKNFRAKGGIDHVITNYHYDDDRLIFAECSWCPPKTVPFEMFFQIVCDKGTIRMAADGLSVHYESGEIEKPDLSSLPGPTGWHAEIHYLLGCISEGKTPNEVLSVADARDAIKIIEAEEASIESGKTVALKF